MEKYFERRKILFLFGFLLYLNRQNDKEGLLHKKIDGFKSEREVIYFVVVQQQQNFKSVYSW